MERRAFTPQPGTRPYRQVARARSQRRTQEALLDVALEEVFNDSWHDVSLESLASRGGVTKQTLLRHFGSKEGLFLQAIARVGAQVMEQRWTVPEGDVRGALDNLIDHYEEWGERSLRIGAWERKRSGVFAKLSKAARMVHYAWVERAFAPWLRDLDDQARARRRAALIAICDVNTWWLLSHDLELPRAEVHATLAAAVEGLLAARSPQ